MSSLVDVIRNKQIISRIFHKTMDNGYIVKCTYKLTTVSIGTYWAGLR